MSIRRFLRKRSELKDRRGSSLAVDVPVVVTGSPKWRDYSSLKDSLLRLAKDLGAQSLHVYHCNEPGADRIAALVCRELGWKVDIGINFPCQTSSCPKKRKFINRKEQKNIFKTAKPVAVIAFAVHGSPGWEFLHHCAEKLKRDPQKARALRIVRKVFKATL